MSNEERNDYGCNAVWFAIGAFSVLAFELLWMWVTGVL